MHSAVPSSPHRPALVPLFHFVLARSGRIFYFRNKCVSLEIIFNSVMRQTLRAHREAEGTVRAAYFPTSGRPPRRFSKARGLFLYTASAAQHVRWHWNLLNFARRRDAQSSAPRALYPTPRRAGRPRAINFPRFIKWFVKWRINRHSHRCLPWLMQ